MKREIDKDLMYEKLMPSNLKAIKTAVQETDAPTWARRSRSPRSRRRPPRSRRRR
jgi:hypothetical protein